MNGIAAITVAPILGWVLPMMAAIAVISVAWWVWENLGDRRLFVPKAATRAVNLSAHETREPLEENPETHRTEGPPRRCSPRKRMVPRNWKSALGFLANPWPSSLAMR